VKKRRGKNETAHPLGKASHIFCPWGGGGGLEEQKDRGFENKRFNHQAVGTVGDHDSKYSSSANEKEGHG